MSKDNIHSYATKDNSTFPRLSVYVHPCGMREPSVSALSHISYTSVTCLFSDYSSGRKNLSLILVDLRGFIYLFALAVYMLVDTKYGR